MSEFLASTSRELRHPCFDQEAHYSHARIHLPVAPKCNVQCNFCDRRYTCVSESRPGVTANVQTPLQAVASVEAALRSGLPLSVVGIAGPGDAFANPEETLETLRRVHERFPELLLCLSTNGLDLLPWIDALENLGVSHLTITVNAVDAAIAAQIYRWIRLDGQTLRGLEAGTALVERQRQALVAAAGHAFVLKVNSVVVPGVNSAHVPSIAKTVANLGADLHNCIPMIPVASTPFGGLEEPLPEDMQRIRALAGAHLPQMTHCNRCRADACGMLE
jgi:nitrogen fixation protein NifB